MKAKLIRVGYNNLTVPSLKGYIFPKDILVDVVSDKAKYIPAELLVEVNCKPKSPFKYYRKK